MNPGMDNYMAYSDCERERLAAFIAGVEQAAFGDPWSVGQILAGLNEHAVLVTSEHGFALGIAIAGEAELTELMKTLETPTLARHLGADTDESRYGQLYGLF
jgi:hypothetical protein